jgi:hypothetical protein
MRVLFASLVAGLAAVTVAACGPPSAALIPTASPRAEALSWFPRDAVAVAILSTDPEQAAVARIASDFPALRDAARELGLSMVQHRPLLGHELVVGLAHPGGSPLAVLVTRDGGTLRALARARVRAHRATPAGRYRSADLYSARGHAFAVRHDVLAVARTTADLRSALDMRAGDEGLDEDDLEVALPDASGPGDVVARAMVDLRPLLDRAGPRARAVPWLGSFERLGVVVRGDGDGLTARMQVDTSAGDLVELDVPLPPGGRAPLVVDVPAPRVSIRDFAHLLGVGEAAAGRAYPLALLSLKDALPAARALAGKLHGPATLVREGDTWLLRAEPSRPLDRELDGLAKSLARALDEQPKRRGGFYELHGIRFAVHRGVLVAGTAPAARLRALAGAPLARPAGAHGTVAISLPQGSTGLPWPITGWLSATPDRLTGEARAGF